MLVVCAVCFFAFVSGAIAIMAGSIQQESEQAQGSIEWLELQPSIPIGLLEASQEAGEDYLEQTLFIGDSNTVRFYVYGLVPLENYMAQEGIGVESVKDFPCVYFQEDNQSYTIPQAVAKAKPRRIVMTFGTNDADGLFTTEEFIEEYRNAVHLIQQAYPYCDIIINSIPPIAKYTQYPKLSQKRIDAFNEALLEMATEEMLMFLDSAQALKDQNGFLKREFVVADGLHLNEAGLKTILQEVKSHPALTLDRRPETEERAPMRKVPPNFGR